MPAALAISSIGFGSPICLMVSISLATRALESFFVVDGFDTDAVIKVIIFLERRLVQGTVDSGKLPGPALRGWDCRDSWAASSLTRATSPDVLQ